MFRFPPSPLVPVSFCVSFSFPVTYPLLRDTLFVPVFVRSSRTLLDRAISSSHVFKALSPPPGFIGLRVFALRCYRVTTHTGNHALSSRFFPNPPMHANLRYFAPLPTHSDLCLSADRCTGIACIFTYTVHHSPTLSRLSPPKTHHAWYASHTEPTVTRLG